MKKNYLEYFFVFLTFLLIMMKNTFFSFNYNSKIIKLNKEMQNTKLLELNDKYNELTKILKLKEDKLNSYVFAEVTFHNIYEFYSSFTIDKGTKEGLKEKMVVVNEKGLIGILASVSKNSAKVNLITNEKNNISVKINGFFGILQLDNEQNLVVANLNNYTNNVSIGDIVYTSGLTDIPADIKVGQVKEIKKDNLDLETILVVEPFVNFDQIDYVAIIKE